MRYTVLSDRVMYEATVLSDRVMYEVHSAVRQSVV